MPRENSFTDSEGRSLTPEPEGEVFSPVSALRRPSKKLHRSNAPPTVRTVTWQNLTPKEKFRASVHKVIALHRANGLSILMANGMYVGAEPGVDPRRTAAEATYGHMNHPCRIEIVDYSAIRNTHCVMSKEEFIDLMDTGSREPPPKPPWAKVRWINICGLSWDVIKAVSIAYDLHPLALEDVFHGHSRTRSKADYYTQHLFIQVLCHLLVKSQEEEDSSSIFDTKRTTSPEPMTIPEEAPLKVVDQFNKQSTGSSFSNGRTLHPLLPLNHAHTYTMKRNRFSSFTRLLQKEGEVQAARDKNKEKEVSLDALKQGERVNVNVVPMFIFLLRDGTVVSLQSSYDSDLTHPISQRLRSRDTVLTKNADPSLLVHALLDLIVDKALEVIDQYHTNITNLEHDILLRPKMSAIKKLHILSGDLILHKRTIEPIKTLVYGLRRYDVDRSEALIDFSDPANKDVKVVGFMSHTSKIYLADVFDHIEYILTSLDMFASIAENLINYSFNLASSEMNEIMRRLTLATIICLPLTILTGYFGMNFDPFWAVNNNSDLLFWKIAIPILVVVTPLALISDLRKLWQYFQHRGDSNKAIQSYKRA